MCIVLVFQAKMIAFYNFNDLNNRKNPLTLVSWSMILTLVKKERDT